MSSYYFSSFLAFSLSFSLSPVSLFPSLFLSLFPSLFLCLSLALADYAGHQLVCIARASAGSERRDGCAWPLRAIPCLAAPQPTANNHSCIKPLMAVLWLLAVVWLMKAASERLRRRNLRAISGVDCRPGAVDWLCPRGGSDPLRAASVWRCSGGFELQ